MMRDVPVWARPQPSVKQEQRKQPRRKSLRRPMMSAMEPARRSEQPHVRLEAHQLLYSGRPAPELLKLTHKLKQAYTSISGLLDLNYSRVIFTITIILLAN